MTDMKIINFDSAVFSVESVQKAIYRMGNKISASIAIIDEIFSELRQTVNDYSLRGKISAETQEMRNLILSAAFSRVISQESE